MTTTPRTSVNVVFGAMTIGRPDVEKARIHDTNDAAALLDSFQRHDHPEVDTARTYGAGSSEECLGMLD